MIWFNAAQIANVATVNVKFLKTAVKTIVASATVKKTENRAVRQIPQ